MLKTHLSEPEPYCVPGFFPTSERVAKIMINHTKIYSGMSVLEPSAGAGAILDMLPEDIHLTCYEISPTLCKRLQTKGYTPILGNFLNHKDIRFDRIIMNPPFETNQDLLHISHAMMYLKPGGILVSLILAKHAQHFKDFPYTKIIDILPGSGKKYGSVKTALIIMDNPHA